MSPFGNKPVGPLDLIYCPLCKSQQRGSEPLNGDLLELREEREELIAEGAKDPKRLLEIEQEEARIRDNPGAERPNAPTQWHCECNDCGCEFRLKFAEVAVAEPVVDEPETTTDADNEDEDETEDDE